MFHYLHVLYLQKPPGMKEEDEPEEEEEEELGHAETYAEYMPMKCKCVLYIQYAFFIVKGAFVTFSL